MKPDQTFHPSHLFYHLADLAELMQATYDILNEIDRVPSSGTRNDMLDRITGMHRIACRDVIRLREMASTFDGPEKWVREEGSKC